MIYICHKEITIFQISKDPQKEQDPCDQRSFFSGLILLLYESMGLSGSLFFCLLFSLSFQMIHMTSDSIDQCRYSDQVNDKPAAERPEKDVSCQYQDRTPDFPGSQCINKYNKRKKAEQVDSLMICHISYPPYLKSQKFSMSCF